MKDNTNTSGVSKSPFRGGGVEVEGQNMFYQASSIIFQRAKELRNNTTESEGLLWNYLCNNKLGLKFRRQHPILLRNTYWISMLTQSNWLLN
jgi:hypothetical protein